jgi:hypothetical protein
MIKSSHAKAVTQQQDSSRAKSKSGTATSSDKTPTTIASLGHSTNQTRGASTTNKSFTIVKSKAASDKKKQAILISRSATTKSSYVREQLLKAVAKLQEKEEEEEEASKFVEKTKKNGGGKQDSRKMRGGKKEVAEKNKDVFHFTCQDSDDEDDEKEEAEASQYEPTQGDVSEYNPTQGDFVAASIVDNNAVNSLRRSSRIKQNSATSTAITASENDRNSRRRSAKDKDVVQEQVAPPNNVEKNGRKSKNSKGEKKIEEEELPLAKANAASRRTVGKGERNIPIPSKKKVAVEEESDDEFLLTQEKRGNIGGYEDAEEESNTNETVQFLECSDDEASGDDGNDDGNDEENSIAANTFNTSKQYALTQAFSMDDSSRSELHDDNADHHAEKCADDKAEEEASVGFDGDYDDMAQPMPKAVATKGKKSKQKSTARENLKTRDLVPNICDIQQPSTKRKGRNTTIGVHKNTRSIPTDPIAFLATYKRNQEAHSDSVQSIESPSVVNNSTKMSSQISLSEEKAKEVVPDEAPDDHDLILPSEPIKSSRKTKRACSALALTEEQVRAIKSKRAKSFSQITDISPITKEDLAAIERVRQRCKNIIEATDFLFDNSDA